MNKKWIGVIVLVVIGIVALGLGIEYLTTPIHKVPSYLLGHPHKRGHYTKRGDVLVVIGVAALAIAGYLFYRIRGEGKEKGAPKVAPATSGPAPASAGSILSDPDSTSESTPPL